MRITTNATTNTGSAAYRAADHGIAEHAEQEAQKGIQPFCIHSCDLFLAADRDHRAEATYLEQNE